LSRYFSVLLIAVALGWGLLIGYQLGERDGYRQGFEDAVDVTIWVEENDYAKGVD
jgi:hypothetical protein